jgi:hypothetical protein
MSEPLLSEPVYTGDLPGIMPEDQPVFLGGDRLLFWNSETGKYCISLIDASIEKGTFVIEPVLQSGALKDHAGFALVWLGSNRILAYHPKTGEGTTLSYNRDDLKGDPIVPEPSQTRIPLPPGSEVIYIGRDRLLCLSPDMGCMVISTTDISGLKPRLPPKRKIPPLSDRITESFDRKTAHPETYTLDLPDNLVKAKFLEAAWLGDDQLAVWDSSSGTGYVGLCEGKKFITQQEFYIKRLGFRPYYIGSGHALVRDIRKRLAIIHRIIVRHVLRPINDYLELHHNVRDAIAWQANGREILYRDWDNFAATERFYSRLARFYTAISEGDHPVFSFSSDPSNPAFSVAPVPGIAPCSTPGGYIMAVDAAQIYLAHVAQSLTIQLSRSLNWQLHDYSDPDLRLILRGSSMFREGSASDNSVGLYMVNADINGNGTPGDPVKGYHFLTGTDPSFRSGRSMIRDTQRETIMELFRWIRDHLCHGPDITGGPRGLSAYGYAGNAPVEKIFSRALSPESGMNQHGPKYYAWFGCHSAAALVVWLMRTVNIPCRGHYTYIQNDTTPAHHGIDFPSQRLFSAHMDNFYAIPFFMDPTIEPLEVFDHDGDYETMKLRDLTPYTPGERRWEQYMQTQARKALAHPTFEFVSAYWYDQIFQYNSFQNLLTSSSFMFTTTEADGLRREFGSRLEAAITSLREAYHLSGSAARNAYLAHYTTWLNNR